MIKDKVFKLHLENNSNEDSEIYFIIKSTKIEQNDETSIMLQIIDVSLQVMYEKQKSLNSLLTLINATVSHELRNPLNSIIAINFEKER